MRDIRVKMKSILLTGIYQSLFITCGSSKEVCVIFSPGSSEPLSALWGMREIDVCEDETIEYSQCR